MSKQSAPRRVGDKEALAVGNTIRGSAQKLNLVAQLIRGRKVGDALNILKFSPKGMAEPVYKVLASAIANAENNHNLDVDALVFVPDGMLRTIPFAALLATDAWLAGAAPLEDTQLAWKARAALLAGRWQSVLDAIAPMSPQAFDEPEPANTL